MQHTTQGRQQTLYRNGRPSSLPLLIPPNHLRPISQRDPRGHFQKQSLSLSSQEVPGLIINKLLMFSQTIVLHCASAVNAWVCAHVCAFVRGQRKVLLDRAFNWPFNGPHPKWTCQEVSYTLWMTSQIKSNLENEKSKWNRSCYRRVLRLFCQTKWDSSNLGKMPFPVLILSHFLSMLSILKANHFNAP